MRYLTDFDKENMQKFIDTFIDDSTFHENLAAYVSQPYIKKRCNYVY